MMGSELTKEKNLSRKNKKVIPMASILIAGMDTEVQSLESALKERHTLLAVATKAQALAALRARIFDLLIIGVRFDESRMLELLRESSQDGLKGEMPPVICFCDRDTRLSPAMHDAMEVVTRAFGVRKYLKQHEIPMSGGDPDGELREAIEGFLVQPTRG
jgi:DNA-binding NtrC family response regulator